MKHDQRMINENKNEVPLRGLRSLDPCLVGGPHCGPHLSDIAWWRQKHLPLRQPSCSVHNNIYIKEQIL